VSGKLLESEETNSLISGHGEMGRSIILNRTSWRKLIKN